MSRTLSPRSAAVAALTGALVLAPIGAAVADQPSEVGTGPSTATAPYVLPVAQGVSITSLLTVGDNPSGAYPMVGIPDGLGAQRAKNGPLTVLMNHEIRDTLGVPRAHGQKGAFGQTNYSAAKAGMHGFTKALALEVAKKGVTVNTISPGYIGTKMVMAIPQEVLDSKILPQIPQGRLGKPEEVAGLVAYLASEEAAFVTGANISINGGQHMF